MEANTLVPLRVPENHSRLRSRRRTIVGGSLLASAIAIGIAGLDRVPAHPNETLVFRGAPAAAKAEVDSIRIATFNIRGGRGRDDCRDFARTAATLADLDVVALQEVHGGWPICDRDDASELGDRLAMRSLFIPTERRFWHNSFGNGLLVRIPAESLHRVPLPATQSCKYRNATLMTVPLQGKTVRILATHIDRVRDRDRQLKTVFDLFLQLERPAILLGDLNTSANDRRLQALLQNTDVTDYARESWPDGRKTLRGVDWIILRGMRCRTTACRDLGASDHAAVCAEVELAPPLR